MLPFGDTRAMVAHLSQLNTDGSVIACICPKRRRMGSRRLVDSASKQPLPTLNWLGIPHNRLDSCFGRYLVDALVVALKVGQLSVSVVRRKRHEQNTDVSTGAFLAGIAKTTAAAFFANLLKFVPEAQAADGASHVEIKPLALDHPLVVELKAMVPVQYQAPAFGNEPDWSQAKLWLRRLDPSTEQTAVVVPIPSNSGEISCLAAAILNGKPATPMVIGITSGESHAKKFSGAIVIYQLDGSKVRRIIVRDNMVVDAEGSESVEPPSSVPSPKALCCSSTYWTCLADGYFACTLCCCYTPPTCVICIGGVTAFCTGVFCKFC